MLLLSVTLVQQKYYSKSTRIFEIIVKLTFYRQPDIRTRCVGISALFENHEIKFYTEYI